MRHHLTLTQLRHRIAQLRKKRQNLFGEIGIKWENLTHCTTEALTSISELQRYDVLSATEDLKMNLSPLNLEDRNVSSDQPLLELSLLSSPWFDATTESLLTLRSHVPGYVALVRELRETELQLRRLRQQLKLRIKSQLPTLEASAEIDTERYYALRRESQLT